MSKSTLINFIGVHFPCSDVPAGIEILPPPETITLLISPEMKVIVTEGQRVKRGEPLCDQPALGTFSSVNGTVHRIAAWNGRNGKQTAVTVKTDPNCGDTANDTRRHLFEPVNDPSTVAPDTLRERCRLCGYALPGKNIPLLVMMLDEDIDRTANRWYFEKEFDLLLRGLKLVKKMCPDSSIALAVPHGCSAEKKRHCSEIGRIISVAQRYPDATVNHIISRDAPTTSGSEIAVIDAKRIAALLMSLTSGCPASTMPLSFKYGRKNASRLFEIPIGMTVGQFLTKVNIPTVNGMQIAIGGEMTGTSVHSLSQPLTPEFDSMLALPPEAVTMSENNRCANCGRCYNACPVELRVDLIGKCVERELREEALRLGIHDCTGCGLCSAVCIMRRPLAHLLASGKRNYPLNGRIVEAAS